jgi:hypothetical protein
MAAAQQSPGKEITWSMPGTPTGRVLLGQPVDDPSGQDGKGSKGQITPLYDTGSGQFLGWQTADGKNIRSGSTNGLAPMIYVPPQKGSSDAAAAAAAPPGSPGTMIASGGAPSYLTGGGQATNWSGGTNWGGTGGGQSTSGATMATGPQINLGGQSVLYKPDGTPISAAVSSQIMSLYQAYEGGDIQSGIAAAKLAQANSLDLNSAVSNLRQGTGPNAASQSTTPPETTALQQIAAVDPTSEALRTAVAGSYLTPLQQAGAPKASDFQSYLDLYKQVADYVTKVTGQAPTSPEDALQKYAQLDPAGFKQMQQLSGAMGSQLTKAQQEASLGSTLDAATVREVEQQTRAGQSARGNIYGTPQLVEEAMARGSAGEARAAQRRADLANANQAMQSYLTSGATAGAVGNTGYQQGVANRAQALGLQQSYLTSGQGLGDIAMNLYNQNQANLRANQQGALSYLGSGQTPYQMGASYLSAAEQNAAQAAAGGPQYNPASLGQTYQASQIPQYGLDTSQNTLNWYNQLSSFMNPGGATKNRTGAALGGAASGALSGAATGATLGSAAGGIGAIPGAIIGGIGGGVLGGGGGYFSAPDRM